jgi:hypothetical protein
MAADDLVLSPTARNFASAGELVPHPLVDFSDEAYTKKHRRPHRQYERCEQPGTLGLERQHKSAAKTPLLNKQSNA